MTLNADGLVTDYLNENYPTTLIKYEYNTDKSLKAKKNYSNNVLSTITLFTFKDGNLVKDSTFSANGSPNYSRTYEYYTDKISTIEYSHKGMNFWSGYQSKNVLKKEIDYNDVTSAVTSIRNFQLPELDAMNRVKKTSYQNNGAGAFTTVGYTYY